MSSVKRLRLLEHDGLSGAAGVGGRGEERELRAGGGLVEVNSVTKLGTFESAGFAEVELWFTTSSASGHL
jgi:hypothetical protein